MAVTNFYGLKREKLIIFIKNVDLGIDKLSLAARQLWGHNI
jgi:hypothetical protein